jgi:hypothetical protein
MGNNCGTEYRLPFFQNKTCIWYRSRQAVSLARSCFSELPAKVLFTRQHELKVRIRETVRHHHFDAVLINGSDMLWAVKELSPEMPTVLIAHYLEHQLLV